MAGDKNRRFILGPQLGGVAPHGFVGIIGIFGYSHAIDAAAAPERIDASCK